LFGKTWAGGGIEYRKWDDDAETEEHQLVADRRLASGAATDRANPTPSAAGRPLGQLIAVYLALGGASAIPD